MHVFAFELTLQESLVREESLGGKEYQLNKKFAGRDEIRTDNVWVFVCNLVSFKLSCSVAIVNFLSKITFFWY